MAQKEYKRKEEKEKVETKQYLAKKRVNYRVMEKNKRKRRRKRRKKKKQQRTKA